MNYPATLIAGIPAENATLFRRLRLAVGDPAALIETPEGQRTLIIRDIEIERARRAGAADHIASPADFAPAGGLDADRATATAQAVAEFLSRIGARRVRTDRTLPYIFAWHVAQSGIELVYDPDLGVSDRRVKTEQEIQWLAEAQRTTELAMEMACNTIAAAAADADGLLVHDGDVLTSERMKGMIAKFLLDMGYTSSHGSIVATAPAAGDCHDAGSGPLRTGEPVIVDIFPRCEATRYHGDCTRTVVHGTPSDTVMKMHAAVVEAKAAAIANMQVGRTAADVHAAVMAIQTGYGFALSRGTVTDDPTIQHGTGHGIGLEVHEPILLDDGGGLLLEGEVFTVEPGLYGRRTGGVRVEDMVVVGQQGARNLNRLHEGLDWTI